MKKQDAGPELDAAIKAAEKRQTEEAKALRRDLRAIGLPGTLEVGYGGSLPVTPAMVRRAAAKIRCRWRVTAEEKLTIGCPDCGAKSGGPCETANGVPLEDYDLIGRTGRRRLKFHPGRRRDYLLAIGLGDNDEEP